MEFCVFIIAQIENEGKSTRRAGYSANYWEALGPVSDRARVAHYLSLRWLGQRPATASPTEFSDECLLFSNNLSYTRRMGCTFGP